MKISFPKTTTLFILCIVIASTAVLLSFPKLRSKIKFFSKSSTVQAQTQLSNQTYSDLPPSGSSNSWAYWYAESFKQYKDSFSPYFSDEGNFCQPLQGDYSQSSTADECYVFRNFATAMVVKADNAPFCGDGINEDCPKYPPWPRDPSYLSVYYNWINAAYNAGILDGVTIWNSTMYPGEKEFRGFTFTSYDDALKMIQNATGQPVSYPPNYNPPPGVNIQRTQLTALVAWNLNTSLSMQVKGNINIQDHEQLNGAVVRLLKADGSPVLGADNQAVQGTITVANSVASYELTWTHPIRTAYSDDIGKTLKIKIDKPGFNTTTYPFTISSVVNQLDLQAIIDQAPCDFNFRQYIGQVAGKDFRNLACSAH